MRETERARNDVILLNNNNNYKEFTLKNRESLDWTSQLGNFVSKAFFVRLCGFFVTFIILNVQSYIVSFLCLCFQLKFSHFH